MAGGKHLEPIEEYIDARRKEGFSCKEIMEALQRKGYAQGVIALADKGYHYRQRIRVLTLMLIVSVLAGVGAVMWNPLGSQGFEPSEDVVAQMELEGKAGQCMMISDPDQRVLCAAELEKVIPDLSLEQVDQQSASFPLVMERVRLLAAIRNDKGQCGVLPSGFQEECSSSVPLLHALLMADPESCSGLAEIESRKNCVEAVLGMLDPSMGKEKLDAHAGIMLEAVQELDESRCQSLPLVVWKNDCVLTVKARRAIESRDGEACLEVDDAELRRLCLSTLQVRLMRQS